MRISSLSFIHQIILISIIFTGVLLVSVSLITHYEVNRALYEIEENTGDIYATIADVIIQGKVENLERVTYEWAVWDDSYLFMGGLFPDYENKHIDPYNFSDAHVDAVIMVNTTGNIRLVHFSNDRRPGNDTESVNILLNTYPRLYQSTEPVSGIALFDDTLVLIVSHPVFPTNMSGVPPGNFIGIRFIDSSLVDEFSSLVPGKIVVTPLTSSSYNYKLPDLYVPYFKHNTEENTFTTTVIHPDISGDPVMAISVLSDFRGPYDQWTILYVIIIILIGMLLYSMALIFWYRNYYYRYIQEIHAQLTAASLGEDSDSNYNEIPSDLKPLVSSVRNVNATVANQMHSLDYSDRILSATEKRWETLLSSAADAILIGDEDGILLCNPRFEELTGYNAKEIVGLAVSELFQDNMDDPECFSLLRNWNTTHVTGTRFIWKICRDGIPEVILDVNLRFVHIEGRYLRFCIGRDITLERILIAQEQEALEQIDKNMAQLAALNDEIRNPLTLISMNAGLIDEPIRSRILTGVSMIDNLVHRLDMGFTESEKVRNFLQRTINGFMKEKSENDE